jgi:hypothetical protein
MLRRRQVVSRQDILFQPHSYKFIKKTTDPGTATIVALKDLCSGVSKHRSTGCVHLLTVAGFSEHKTAAIAEYFLYYCTTREALI